MSGYEKIDAFNGGVTSGRGDIFAPQAATLPTTSYFSISSSTAANLPASAGSGLVHFIDTGISTVEPKWHFARSSGVFTHPRPKPVIREFPKRIGLPDTIGRSDHRYRKLKTLDYGLYPAFGPGVMQPVRLAS